MVLNTGRKAEKEWKKKSQERWTHKPYAPRLISAWPQLSISPNLVHLFKIPWFPVAIDGNFVHSTLASRSFVAKCFLTSDKGRLRATIFESAETVHLILLCFLGEDIDIKVQNNFIQHCNFSGPIFQASQALDV